MYFSTLMIVYCQGKHFQGYKILCGFHGIFNPYSWKSWHGIKVVVDFSTTKFKYYIVQNI